MTTLDLDALAALRPQAAELAARVKAGDVSACFDADEFLEGVNRITADARAFVARATVHTRESDYANTLAREAADGFEYLVGHLTGSSALQAELDDARDLDDA